MSSEERERQLAGELAPELAALAEIDRILQPPGGLPERLSGHRIISEIGSAAGHSLALTSCKEKAGRAIPTRKAGDRTILTGSGAGAPAIPVHRRRRRSRV